MDLDKKNMKKIMLIIAFAISLFTLLQRFEIVLSFLDYIWEILFPFVLGGAIAFVLNVPMHFFEEKLQSITWVKNNKFAAKIRRPISVVVAIALVIGILVIVLFLVIPELGRTFATLGTSIKDFVPEAQSWILKTFDDNKEIAKAVEGLELNWETMVDSAVGFLKIGAGNLLSSSMSITMTIFGVLMDLVIAIVFACYILLQKEKLARQVTKIIHACLPKEKVEAVLEVASLSYRIFSNFITGQCIEAMILGTMFFVSMIILDFPYALLVGVLIAFTALIPIVGAFIGCAVGAFLIFMQDPMQAFLFVVLFLVLQQIEGNLIYPHVVGNSVGLPSIWVLFSVTVGGSLMGIVGMLIFIPIMSVIYVLFGRWVRWRLDKKQIDVSQI